MTQKINICPPQCTAMINSGKDSWEDTKHCQGNDYWRKDASTITKGPLPDHSIIGKGGRDVLQQRSVHCYPKRSDFTKRQTHVCDF